MMKLIVNGEERELPDGTTIAALLSDLNLPADATVAERNGDIIPRDRHAETILTDGDTIELIRFVGGG